MNEVKLKSSGTLKVAWPTPQDYSEALQHPRHSFADAELADGHVVTDSLGLPRVASGMFASVYKLDGPSGSWAVRCFLSNLPETVERYVLIEDALRKAYLGSTVEFDLQEEGIKIHSRTYPMLKMQWCEGLSLTSWLAKHIHDSQALSRFMQNWQQTVADLQNAGIAHGDLQHGNILIDGEKLRLVDYDGMYVPSLGGKQSCELGHRNYQHPERDKTHYGPYLDNFAASLIYFSVKILSIDNELWHKFTGGDECILFRDRDLKNPLQSEIFAFIQEHRSRELREAALIIRQLLAMEIDKVPPLDEVLKWQPSNIAQLESNLPKIEPENIRRQSNRNNTTSSQTKLAGATKENEQWWSAHTQNSGSPNSQHQAAPFQSNKQGTPKPTAKASGFQHKPALLFCTAAGIVITAAGFAGYAQYQKFVQDTKTNEQIIKQHRELERASSQRKANIAPPVQTPAPPKKQAQPREAMEDRCTFDLNYAQKLEETATPANKQLAQAELNYYRVNILYKDKQLNDREEALVNRAKQGLVRTYWEDMDATQKNIELERVVGTASIAVLDSADSAMKNNNYNKAIELYTKFLKTKIDSNSAITIIAHGRAYSHLAKTYLAKGDLKNAKISAIKSLQLFRYITGDDSVDSLQALLLLCDVSDRMNEKQFAVLSCARVVDASEGKAYFTEVYKDALALQKRLGK